MAAVPLVLERIRKGILATIDQKSPLAKGLFHFMLAYKEFWRKRGYDTPLVNRVLCAKIRGQVGGQLKYMIAGGAPLSPDTQAFIRSAFGTLLAQGWDSWMILERFLIDFSLL